MIVSQILRKSVDSEPTYCHLNASLCAGGEIGTMLEEKINLKGAKEPFNYFNIVCDPDTAGM